jgi:cell division protein ZapA
MWHRPEGSTTLKIEIYDQTYNIAGEQNEEYMVNLASYVDEKMREVADATRTVDSVKVAVLAALNIADELFTLRERQQEITGPLRQRVQRCMDMVEQALDHSN